VASKRIALGKGVNLDLSRLAHMLITSSTGGGKSNTDRVLLERSNTVIPQFILDWEDEFVTLREVGDYVIVGPGRDIDVPPEAASEFIRKFAEEPFNVIVALHEMPLAAKHRWALNALQAFLDLPRELQNDVLIVVSEAHHLAPEQEKRSTPSPAKAVLADLASRGRKRGQKLVLDTQRLAKLDKDIAAECQTKLIGVMNLDDDRSRGARELGAKGNREVERHIQDFEPGSFYALGPGFGLKRPNPIRIDLAVTKDPPRGRAYRPPAPRATALKAIEGLKDLPRQATERARTLEQANAEIRTLKRDLKLSRAGTPKQPIAPDPALAKKVAHLQRELDAKPKERPILRDRQLARLEAYEKRVEKIADKLEAALAAARAQAGEVSAAMRIASQRSDATRIASPPPPPPRNVAIRTVPKIATPAVARIDDEVVTANGNLGKGERAILQAIAQHESGADREQISVLAGYRRSTRNTYLQRLQSWGYIEPAPGDTFVATIQGIEALGDGFQPLPTGSALRDYWMRKLPEGERIILEALIKAWPTIMPREELDVRIGGAYKRSSRNTYLQRLSARHLVTTQGDLVKASDNLFDSEDSA
jgi:hypothetical protein